MSTVPTNMMGFIQNLIPGFGGMPSSQQQPSYSDGNGFDVWTSARPMGLPDDFMNFMNTSGANASTYNFGGSSQQPPQSAGYPGFQGFSPQANFPFPIEQGPYQTVPVSQDGYNWGAPQAPLTSGYSPNAAQSGGYPGFQGFSPQVNFPFPIEQEPYQTGPVAQDGYNWGALQAPLTNGYSPNAPQAGGYPGFQGFSPQVNLPFPIQQGAYQTNAFPQSGFSATNASGGQQPQLMSHFYSDGNTTYWGETKPDGYYQFTPSGNSVNVERTEGYDDPNPYNYAYHPFFSGWASSAPNASGTSQNPYYGG